MIKDLINELGYEEVLSLAKKTGNLLVKHIEWLKNVQRTLICKLPLEKSLCYSEEEYRSCEFGKWYYSVDSRPIIENKEFIELGKKHKLLHDRACDLLMKHKSNRNIIEDEYDSFSAAQKDFIEHLQKIISEVDTSQFKFDVLTNLLNREVMKDILEKEYYRVIRSNSKCCIVMADIDYFKNVNDTYGHLIGDKVLKAVANCFVGSLRKYDTVGRYGGEEFLFCLPETHMDKAMEITERLRQNVASLQIETGKQNTINVTCSFGITEMDENLSIKEIVNNADKAMYRAKDAGRNRTST